MTGKILVLLSLLVLPCIAGELGVPVFQKGMTFTHGYRPQNNLMSAASAGLSGLPAAQCAGRVDRP
jgi:hypothetical protein